MSPVRPICRRACLLAGLVLSIMLATAGVALASETFGELERFGAPGSSPGELTPSILGFDFTVFQPWHVIGVEPKNNDVYVLEEDKEPSENGKGEETRFLRLQELNPAKKGELLGHSDFSYKSPPAENDAEAQTIEGITVDPEKGRLYFLIDEQRATEVPEEEESAAASLYAFKTAPNAKKELEPVAGTPKEPIPLAGPEKLQPTSNTPGLALLEPHGITLDPNTHEVVIVAHNDECKEEGGVECEEDALENGEDHYVTQRVKENGELGESFVDSANVFKVQLGEDFFAPGSPVVAGSGASERLLANNQLLQEGSNFEDALDQFPATHSGTPSRSIVPDTAGVQAGFEEIGEEESDIGGSLLASADGKTLYGLTIIKNEETAGKTEGLYGIAERSAETLAPIGWTGGQQSSATDKCALQPGLKDGEHPQIALGSGGDVFVLVPEYLREPPSGEGSFPTKEAIIEFGPGGEGCPKASAEKNIVSVAGKEATGPVPVDQPITLSSFIKQGDALSVVWKIENEATKAVVSEEQKTDQYQKPTLVHEFTTAGKYKITEEIKTDNLDTPTLTVTSRPSLTVEEKTEAIVITKQPESTKVTAGTPAKFTTAATGIPAPSPKWFVSSDGGVKFEPDEHEVTGDKGTETDSLEVLTTEGRNGYEYYAEFTAKGLTAVRTETVTLTVTEEAPKVTLQPKGSTVTAGESATFTSTASGAPPPTVQWEVNPGSGWSPIAGATKSPLVVPATTVGESGYRYRATFKNKVSSVTSSEATLTVDALIVTPPGESGAGTGTPPPGEGGHLGEKVFEEPKKPHIPDATIASAPSVTVSSSGAFSIAVTCPAGATTCIGTVTLKTLTAVSASAHAAKAKKAILTVATGAFSVAGGSAKTVTLHLSALARKLLAHAHVITARATVAAHDPAGEPQTTSKVLTLRPAKAKHKG